MKRQWRVRRQYQSTSDAERRWDQAYQYLVDWTTPPKPYVGSTPVPPHKPQTEDMYENGHLCPRVDRASDTGTHH